LTYILISKFFNYIFS